MSSGNAGHFVSASMCFKEEMGKLYDSYILLPKTTWCRMEMDMMKGWWLRMEMADGDGDKYGTFS